MSNQDPFLSREQDKYDNPVPSREFILTHLQTRQKPAYSLFMSFYRLG